MSENIIYDVTIRILVDSYKILSEIDHPKASVIKPLSKDFPMLLTSASERLSRVNLDSEHQQIQEFFKYAITTLTRAHLAGDWRPYVFLSELFYEILPLKRLHEWVLDITRLNPSPKVAEINSIAPLTSAKITSRIGGESILLLDQSYLENTLLSEIIDEYSRRYAMNQKIVPLKSDEINSLRETIDMLYVGSFDGWKIGWQNILSLASQLVKRRGYLSLILPLNQREGLKTLLAIFDIPEYPTPEQIMQDLQRQRFSNIFTSRGPGFIALTAVKR